jgi:hypothetical protein
MYLVGMFRNKVYDVAKQSMVDSQALCCAPGSWEDDPIPISIAVSHEQSNARRSSFPRKALCCHIKHTA